MRRAVLLATLGAGLCAGHVASLGQESSQETPAPAVQTPPVFLKDKARKEFCDEVEKKMSELRSIAATFTQEKHLALFKEPLRSKGQVLFATPDLLRWEFISPFRSVLVVAGDQVAKFEQEEHGWHKVKQGRQAEVILVVMDNIRSWFRGKFDPEGEAFDVDVAREPEPLIVMRPKDPLLSRNLREVELKLAADYTHVVEVTIREASGDRTVMKFEQLKRDSKADLLKSYFSLEEVLEVEPKDLETPEPKEGEGETQRDEARESR